MESTEATAIQSLQEISGLGQTEAKYILEINGNNLDAAISYYFEQNSSELIVPNIIVDSIRDPIPPRRERLLQTNDDQFIDTPSSTRRKRKAHSLCPMRDFQREAELQEQIIFSINNFEQEKPQCLEDLFRPPIDLCFVGNLKMACLYATQQNRWLLCNIQDYKFFHSQILNRDIWSSELIRGLIKNNFIFWQVANDCVEGIRFTTFYKVVSLPYVAILDPRTGEERKQIWPNSFPVANQHDLLKVGVFEDLFRELIQNNPCPNNSSKMNSFTPSSSNSSKFNINEEEELNIAINNSIKETGINYKKFLGVSKDITKLQIRLESGERLFLEWPADTKLAAISSYVQTELSVTHENLKYICPILRNNLLDMDQSLDMRSANLHPTCIIHLQKE